MNKPESLLTKICSNCGQRKPLSAFLQLAGSHGYGNICSSCRKTVLTTKDEEGTKSTSGAKIDAKLKVQDAIDKREVRKQIEDEYFDERDKKEERHLEKREKIGTIADKEKKHRHDFLGKQSFLSPTKAPPGPAAPGTEEQKTKEGKLDFATGPVESTRVAGLIKTTQSPIFQAFKSWLGNAPIVSAAEKAANTAKKATNQEKKEPKAPAPADPASEYVSRNTGPKSRS